MTPSKAAQLTRLLSELFPDELQAEEQQQLGQQIVALVGKAAKGNWDLRNAVLFAKGARRADFGTALKKLRAAAGFTQEDITGRARWHVSKLSRIETGKVAITYVDLQYLLMTYGAIDQLNALWALAMETGQGYQPRSSRTKAS